MLIFVNHDDLRGQEVMEELVKNGYYVTDEWKDLRYCQMIYLGLKGIDRKNRLLLHRDTIIVDEKTWKQLHPQTIIITMIHNDYLDALSKQYGFQYYAFLDEEDFVDRNSILTAEGVISYLISHRRFPIYHSQIHVLGYGHCGQVIVRDFIALRAYVHVGIRNCQLFEDIEKAGAKPYHLDHMDLSDCDVLINTIPSQVVTSSKLDQAPTSMMILDIASYPYGVDHHYALSKGFNSIILPSIPSKYAYGYAGRMMTDFMKEKMKNV